MPQRKTSKMNIPCPNCGKPVVRGQARWADCSPRDVVRYSRTESRILIGQVYFHGDGTLCDMSIFTIKQLPKPVFLRLGDPKIDPRI